MNRLFFFSPLQLGRDILSGSGFSKRNIEFAEKFNYPGFAVGLIDAVTKKLYVNRNTEEGKNFDKMLLSECVR